jgi:antitoxin MazE
VDPRSDGKRIVLTPLKARPRQGWAEAAREMHRLGDDELLIPNVFDDEADLAW